MENKTDKPYSLQDAKDTIARELGYKDWESVVWYEIDESNCITSWPYSDTIALNNAAELYASKATEELRKECNEWKFQVNLAEVEIERLKESNKALEQNRLADDIQMHDLYAKIRTLEESNKELVEALRDTIHRMSKARVILFGKNLDDWQMLNASKYESLVLKSEGDVNKKI